MRGFKPWPIKLCHKRKTWTGMEMLIIWKLYERLKFDHTDKCYTRKTENQTHKIFWDFEIKMNHVTPARRPDLVLIIKKQTTSGFCFSSKIPSEKDIKRKDFEKYLVLARELKKLWNIQATVIPVAIGALGTVYKALKNLEESKASWRIVNILSKALLRSGEVLRKVLEDRKDLVSSSFQWNPTGYRWWQNFAARQNFLFFYVFRVQSLGKNPC